MSLDQIQEAARDQFGKQSHRYGTGHILANVSDLEDALSEIALPIPARVLDVACGAGHTGLHLASLGHTVTLTDISSAMLARVNETAAERALHVTTREHAAERLPYESGSFDLVTCRVAAHHFSSPPDFISETARVLAPGGWFLLIDGSVPDGEPEAEDWIHRIEKLRDPSHHRFLTPRAWAELCESNALTVSVVKLVPMKQPDLDWYFDTAGTTPENRAAVRALIADAPAAARRVFELAQEQEKTVWWWPRLTLVARKASH
jgi:ubiquinone/menaquinone biosynthesis C-methylase UbiE